MIRGQHQYFWNGATVWRKRRCGKPIMPMALWPAFCPGRSRAFKTNPCTNGDKLNQGTRVDKIWSDEDVARFLRTAPSYLHLAMLLAINTGQRQGDLLRLLWSAYDGKEIKMRQRKTGAYVPIPVSDALKTALDAASRKSPIMLVTATPKTTPSARVLAASPMIRLMSNAARSSMRHARKRRRRPTNSRESVQGHQHFRRVLCQPIDLTHKTRPKHHISRLKRRRCSPKTRHGGLRRMSPSCWNCCANTKMTPPAERATV